MKIRLLKKGEQPRGATLEIDGKTLGDLAGIEISDGDSFYAISLVQDKVKPPPPSEALFGDEAATVTAATVTRRTVKKFTRDLLSDMTWPEVQALLGVSKTALSGMRNGKVTDTVLERVNSALAE